MACTTSSIVGSLVAVMEFVMPVVVIEPHGFVPSPMLAWTHISTPHVTVQRLMLTTYLAVPPAVVLVEFPVRSMMSPPGLPVPCRTAPVIPPDAHSACVWIPIGHPHREVIPKPERLPGPGPLC